MRPGRPIIPFRLAFGQLDPRGPPPDGYPPYNLERLPGETGRPERLRLVFAVAGFAPRELDVSVVDRHLIVKGEQSSDAASRQFIYRGIAGRRFQRIFLLDEELEVGRADLGDGLLSVELQRRDAGSETRTIRIMSR